MKKLVFALFLCLFLLPGHLLAACVLNSISVPGSESDSWDSSCTSTNRSGRYAQYYDFTLTTTREVTINLQSSVDTYLLILSGSGTSGTVLDEDDDGGVGTNSQIVIILTAGTYTIEATTFTAATTGDFVVSVSTETPSPGACSNSITPNSSRAGSWQSDCLSTNRAGSYAEYYTFTLSSRRRITIDLESSVDAYMFLLRGSGTSGIVLDEDDDGGDGTDSRIVITLAAGTYTVEATTFDAATAGNFIISVNVTGCPDCPFEINAGLNDAWYDLATSGQGFAITVLPELEQVFVAWFTFDTELPPEGATAMIGWPGHRWLTAQGPYDGDTAELTIYVTSGGVFDSAQPVAETDQDGDGTLTLEFADCNEGLVTYEISSLGISGEIPIQRVVEDNVPLCELLAFPDP